MAGSWRHMTTRSGMLRNNESFCDMIENPGDAYGAAGECFGMVYWLADQAAAATGGARTDFVQQAVAHYKEGLRLGGVQQPR